MSTWLHGCPTDHLTDGMCMFVIRAGFMVIILGRCELVTGIDPRDDGDYRSKKASEVRRMIAKFGDQPPIL